MIACGTMDTGNKIKALRTKHAMTQEDLAAKAGVGIATVQRAERGQRPALNTLASIAAAFDIPAADLTDDGSDVETFEPYLPLRHITSGRQLVTLLRAGPNIDFGFCELDNLDDARAIELFHDFCSEVAAQAGPLSPVAQVVRELEGKDRLAKLTDRGFLVGGAGFDVKAYEVDDDGGMGMGIILAQWEETRTALRVGRSADEIARAHILDTLGQYENVTGAVVYPPSPPSDGWGVPDTPFGAQEA
jgi:transcriptional regulator with XRE-family HTH domain